MEDKRVRVIAFEQDNGFLSIADIIETNLSNGVWRALDFVKRMTKHLEIVRIDMEIFDDDRFSERKQLTFKNVAELTRKRGGRAKIEAEVAEWQK